MWSGLSPVPMAFRFAVVMIYRSRIVQYNKQKAAYVRHVVTNYHRYCPVNREILKTPEMSLEEGWRRRVCALVLEVEFLSPMKREMLTNRVAFAIPVPEFDVEKSPDAGYFGSSDSRIRIKEAQISSRQWTYWLDS
jgi:hypothetical protein